MSLPEGRLTRRQILSGAATLPAFALAQRALAATPAPTPPVVGLVMAAIERPIPPAQLVDILNDVKGKHSNLDEGRYQIIISILWEYFDLGVDRASQGKVQIPQGADPNGERVAWAAYDHITGEEIAKHLLTTDPAQKYPGNNNHTKTNICAYVCGEHAAAAAKYSAHPTMVTAETYRSAWDVTKQEMDKVLARARAAAQLIDPNATLPNSYMGMGC